jgi:hypothetical protein
MAEDSSENARRARPKDEDALKDEQIKRPKQTLGTDGRLSRKPVTVYGTGTTPRRSKAFRMSGSGSATSGGRMRPSAACRPGIFGRGLSCGTSPRHRATGSWGRGVAGGGRPATNPPVRPSSGRS